MFPIRPENVDRLKSHNIQVTELNNINMSHPPRKLLHLPKVRMLSQRGRSSTGIRITNVKSIKPPDPQLVKQQQEEKLRAELQKEIVNRSRVCANKNYDCLLPVVSGYQYCSAHILQDPTAPYKKCEHNQCQLPAPLNTNDNRDLGLCFEHARAALYARQRSTLPPPPVLTTETLLNQLQHYVRPERTRTTSCASSVSVVSDPADLEVVSPQAVDPFKQIDARSVNAMYCTSLMECASGTDSDADSVTLGEGGNCRSVKPDPELDEPEDIPNWHAGVFTAEEAVSEARGVLSQLQSAYVRQMGRLATLMHTARREYLRALKADKEQYCSIHTQSCSGGQGARERRQLRKLKALAAHRRRRGQDAVLARKLTRKRAKVNEPVSHRPVPSQGRCVFTEGGVRCPLHVVPAAKHCIKHILLDRHQVLFIPCGDPRGVGRGGCGVPAAKLPLPSLKCRYHTDPPQYTHFTLKKDDSESDSDSQMSSESATDDAEPPETFAEAVVDQETS